MQGLSLLIKNAIRQTPELHFTYSNKCLLSLIYINVLNFEKSQYFIRLCQRIRTFAVLLDEDSILELFHLMADIIVEAFSFVSLLVNLDNSLVP